MKTSEWEDILFPKPKSDEDKKWDKEFKKVMDSYHEKLPLYEKFFNEVWPYIEQ